MPVKLRVFIHYSYLSEMTDAAFALKNEELLEQILGPSVKSAQRLRDQSVPAVLPGVRSMIIIVVVKLLLCSNDVHCSLR